MQQNLQTYKVSSNLAATSLWYASYSKGNCKWCSLWQNAQTLLSKCHTVSRYTCKCDFIYPHEKYSLHCANLHATNYEKCYVQISYTEFHSLDNKHGKYEYKVIDTPKNCFHCTDFLKFPQQHYAQIFRTEFTQTGQEIREECVQIHLFPEIKYDDHRWLSQTHASSTAFSKELLH